MAATFLPCALMHLLCRHLGRHRFTLLVVARRFLKQGRLPVAYLLVFVVVLLREVVIELGTVLVALASAVQ